MSTVRARTLALVLVVAAAAAACGDGGETAGPPPTTGAPGSSAPVGSPSSEPSTGGAGPATDPDGIPVLYGQATERDPATAADGRDVELAATGSRAFALDLYRTLAAGTAGDVVVGPASVSAALTMALAGAQGRTAEQLAGALHLDTIAGDRLHPALNALAQTLDARIGDDAVDYATASRAWGQEGLDFADDFLDTLTRFHGAPLAVADFSADPEGERAAINAWTAERTAGHVEELFPPGTISDLTRLVLVNAAHLDAPWEFAFDPAQTRDGLFHLPDGTVATVPFMHYDLYLPNAVSDEWAAVEIPYAGGALSMVVIVPDDLAAFEADLDIEGLDRVLDQIDDAGIHLSLPRFSATYHTSLVEPLHALGVVDAFDPAAADFSGMGPAGLYVAAVEHEAFVVVDEEGTEAGAATGVAMADSHGPTITVDRPFLFLIQDRGTETILFMGRITDPRE
jgi:serpin B